MLGMATTVERVSMNMVRYQQFPTMLLQRANEVGWVILRSPLLHSLLLAATIGFGIKLNHNHDQALAELSQPAYTTSQIQQRERVLESATQRKKDWEGVGILIAGLTFVRMALASKGPTPEKTTT